MKTNNTVNGINFTINILAYISTVYSIILFTYTLHFELQVPDTLLNDIINISFPLLGIFLSIQLFIRINQSFCFSNYFLYFTRFIVLGLILLLFVNKFIWEHSSIIVFSYYFNINEIDVGLLISSMLLYIAIELVKYNMLSAIFSVLSFSITSNIWIFHIINISCSLKHHSYLIYNSSLIFTIIAFSVLIYHIYYNIKLHNILAKWVFVILMIKGLVSSNLFLWLVVISSSKTDPIYWIIYLVGLLLTILISVSALLIYKLTMSNVRLYKVNERLNKSITENQFIKRELEQNERKYRMMNEANPNIIWLADSRGNTIYFNQSFTNLTGLVENSGIEWVEIIHPNDVHGFMAKYDNAMKIKSSFDGEFRLKNKNNEYIRHTYRGIPIFDEMGNICNWVGIYTDIQELYTAYSDLKNQIEKYNAMLNTLPGTILLLDKNYKILEYKSGKFKLFNKIENTVGKPLNYIIKNSSYRKVIDHLKWVNSHKKIKIDDFYIKFENETKYFEIRTVPIDNMTLSLITDISELLHMKQVLEQQNENLKEFSRSMAHDLISPARSIEGLAQILKQDYLDILPSDAQLFIENIIELSVRMSMLVEASQGHLKLRDEIKIQKNYIMDILNWAKKSIKYNASKPINIEFDGEDELISSDFIQIGRVFGNLFENSIKFNDKNVCNIRVAWKKSEDKYIFNIVDNGIGIKHKYFNKIFNVFERLNNNIEGSGIGLSMCRKIITYHGGEIYVSESELGSGTTFTIILPL